MKVGFQMVGLEQCLKLSENWTIQNLDYIVRISFVYQEKSHTIGLLSIQIDKYEISKKLCPDFRSHLKFGPFANQPLFDHSKSGHVRISDPHFIQMFIQMLP